MKKSSILWKQVCKARKEMAKWPKSLLSGLRLEGASDYCKKERSNEHK